MMVETETKQLNAGNTTLLRVAQALAAALVLAIRLNPLKEALRGAVISDGADLVSQMLILLIALGLAISLTSISFSYLHAKLMNTPWGVFADAKVRRTGFIAELLAVIIASSICWIAWPQLARSAYFGYQTLLDNLAAFWEVTFFAAILVMSVFGGAYSIFLFRRTRKKQAEHG